MRGAGTALSSSMGGRVRKGHTWDSGAPRDGPVSRHKKSHGSFAEVEGSCNQGASGGHLSGWPSDLESAAPRLISTELARTWAEGWLSMQSLELLKKSNRIYGMLSCEICTNLLPYFCHKNCEFISLMHPFGFTTQKSIKSYFEFSYF